MKYLPMLILVILSSCSLPEKKAYQIEITYCDNRPKDTVNVMDYTSPNKFQVQTYKQAVPQYKGYLNVCDIKTLKEIK
jgi:hypothetical protein